MEIGYETNMVLNVGNEIQSEKETCETIVLNWKFVIPAKMDAAPKLSGVGVCENICDNVSF